MKAATGEDRDRRRTGRRGRAHAHLAVWPTIWRPTTNTRCRSRARSSRNLNRDAKAAPADLAPAPEDPLYDPAEILWHRARGAAQAVRHPRGHRAPRRRQPLPRVQAAVRHRRSSRGFAHVFGYPVGIIANNGILFSESALKAAHFIELCCQRRIPLVFLQNITGFMVGKKYENGGIAKRRRENGHGGRQRAGAEIHRASSAARSAPATTACAGAPTARVCCGCGPTRASRSWAASRRRPSSSPSSSSSSQRRARRSQTPRSRPSSSEPTLEKYERGGLALLQYGAPLGRRHLSPVETRKYLALGLATAYNAPVPATGFGVFRM